MKKEILCIAIIILSAVNQAKSQEEQLGVTFDLTYLSKWLSKGVEAYGSHGALFKTVDLDFWDSGFGLKVTHRNAFGSGYVDQQRFDYRPYYNGRLFEDTSYTMNYNLSAGYEHYPRRDRKSANTTWEWIFAFSWPNILPEGFTPSYIAHYEYAAGENYTKQSGADIPSGWVHRFILGYDLKVLEAAEPLRLSGELAYTDGLGGAEHDWSYATFGVSTELKITNNLSFLPGVYHQISMEDSVATHDVTYTGLSMRYKF
jgi:hypothetical protein